MISTIAAASELQLFAHPFSSYCQKVLIALWVDEANLGEGPWAAGERFTLADCAAAPALFYADWVQEIGRSRPRLAAYRARLLDHHAVARAVDEARPYRHFFPLGAPDRD